MAVQIGLIGVVGEELAQDFWSTLRRISTIGYRGIEAGGATLGKAELPVSEIKARLDDLGLTPVAYHATRYSFAESGGDIIEKCQGLGCEIIVLSWGPCESRKQLIEDAALYNRIGEQCKAHGIQLTYHNHEFRRFDGQYGFDISAGLLPPQQVRHP